VIEPAAAAPRVYWLTEEFFPPERGGTGVIASRLAQGLAKRGVLIQVITRQTLPPSVEREVIGNVRVRRIPPPGRLKGAGGRALPAMFSYMSRIMFLLVTEWRHYDVVVVSGMKIIPLVAVPICRLLKKKCVVRVESPFEIVEPISSESLGMMNKARGRILASALKAFQRRAITRAHCVVAISDDIANLLKRIEPPLLRILSIPNAADLELYEPIPGDEREQLRKRLGFPVGSTIVLYVGRLSRAKGLMMMLEAWLTVSAAHPSTLLVMVGSGKGSWDDCEGEIVEYIRRHDLGARVTLTGQSDRVHEYLQAADVFVSPSDYEGFSLTLVEALGCAIPVVTTAVGAAPQIIREGMSGFLCPPKDVEALRAAIELALQRRTSWSSIGRLGREAVAAFDIPNVVERYMELLRQLHG
jgi:glycosyltransferase involved in cell wall biosynthesis